MGIVVSLICFVASGHAQINPGIQADSWREGPHRAETIDELLLFQRAQAKGTNLVTGTFYWNSYGRIKTEKDGSDCSFILGYKALSVGFDANSPIKNGDFWDVAVIGGARVGEFGDGWQLEVLGGAGSANDSHWGNADAIYGAGVIGATKQLSYAASVHSGVYYDGNRDLLPEVPLPYITYRREFCEEVGATIGFPASAILYHPLRYLGLTVDYTFPDEFTARSACDLTRNVSLFVQYARSTDAFHIERRGSERLFYELERVNGGIRWITKWFDASTPQGRRG